MAKEFSRPALRYPVIHRRKVPFRPFVETPAGFVAQQAEIQRIDRELDGVYLTAPDYLELVKEAFDQNIHYATEIEGNPLDLDEVRRTTRKAMEHRGPTGAQPDAAHQEIINHLRIWIQPALYRPPWRLSTITDTHAWLMSGVDDDAQPGKLRDNDEVGVYSSHGELLLRPAPHKHLVAELESLVAWINHAAPALQPVAAATVLFHEFESIHPFEDGNGRVGRTLFHAYLQESGLSNANHCIIEPRLVGDRERYYELLAWADQEGEYTPLLDHFSTSILEAYREALERFRSKDLLSTSLDETGKQLLKFARRHHDVWFTLQDASLGMQASDQTVRRHLNDLVALQALEARGTTRAKRYRFANPFREYLAHVTAETNTAA